MRMLNKRDLIVVMFSIIVTVTITSFYTEYRVRGSAPKIAVIDLMYLNNDFTMNVARYLSKNNVSDEGIRTMVNKYLKNLDHIVKDLNQENVILIQKQTIVSRGLRDITPDVEKILFETITRDLENGDDKKI